MTDRPYTPRTLAERWNCSDRHIRNLIKRGELDCFRIGGLIRIAVEEVERIEAGEPCTTSDSAPAPAIGTPSEQTDVHTAILTARLIGPSPGPDLPGSKIKFTGQHIRRDRR